MTVSYGTPLERAAAAMRVVDRYAELSDDERLEATARGLEIGKAQAAYSRHAIAFSLVSIATSLERIVAVLDEAGS